MVGYVQNKCVTVLVNSKYVNKIKSEGSNEWFWKDNRIKNLRLLCPNCHSQTPTWGKKTRDYLSIKPNKAKKCKICNNNVKRSQKYCSIECTLKDKRTSKRPNKEQLLEDATEMSLRKVAKKYEVSDRTVRKWLIYYDINLKKSFSGKTVLTRA